MVVDAVIAELAGRQRGVVSREQLLQAGVSVGAISTRVSGHRLHRLHRGVYAVGHTALVPLARETAALLACGGTARAAISHRSAAWLWRLLAQEPDAVEVTVAREARRKRPGLRVHTSAALAAADVQRAFGLRLTTPARTLQDLAEEATDRELERAYDEAVLQHLTSRVALLAAVRRLPGRRGARRLGTLLDRDAEPALTRSQAEERLLALIRDAGLPGPQVNARIGAYEIDFLWRQHRLVVEVDGYRFHSSRNAFERDRRRDAELQARGFRVVRITWRQLVEQPLAVVARLAQLLAVSG
jgi:very-short-patch-repair endonuclease